MTWERAGRLAWIAPVLAAASVALGPIIRGTGLDGVEWLFKVTFVVYAGVGALIASRRPRNAVGWLFCWIGVAYAAGDTLSSYTADLSRPGALALAVFQNANGGTDLIAVVLLLLLFPTGHYLSAGWRRAGTAALAACAAWILFNALEPGHLSAHPHIRNPLGLDAASGVLHALTSATPALITALLVLAAAGVVDRVRRARGLERQQLRWLGLSVLFAAAVLAVLFALSAFVNLDTGVGETIGGALLALVFAGPAVAAAVAMLRYRLYDIDVVINRALVYGALTVTLGAAYLGLVLLIGLAVGRSGFAVAVSTLAVAALFRPARARIQGTVDQRFYRRRYDAARTLEAFGGRLRDELDLETLGADLRGVVHDTVQPAHVSLWLRGPR
jgi:hypothetical protein